MTFVDTPASPAPSTTSRLDAEPPSDPAEQCRYILVLKLSLPELEPTKDQLFTLMVHQWAQSKAADPSHADQFINRLVNSRAMQTEVQGLTALINQLPPEEQALAIELVAGGAFTRRELKEPERIVAYFARPDWMEIVAAWRTSPLTEIGQVIQRLESEQRRKSKERTPPPPPASTGNGRGPRDPLVGHLKDVLPRALRSSATDFAEALRALAADPIVGMDAKALATAVRRRRTGTGTRVGWETIAAGLPHLAEHGYVILEGGKARIRPGALE